MVKIACFKIICTDSTEILFSKLRSPGLNYHLPKCKFFHCAGVSNKHCFMTFFIKLRFVIKIFVLFIIECLSYTGITVPKSHGLAHFELLSVSFTHV